MRFLRDSAAFLRLSRKYVIKGCKNRPKTVIFGAKNNIKKLLKSFGNNFILC